MPRGFAKSPEAEAARCLKISEGRRRKMAEQGFLNTPATRLKIAAAQAGKIQSPEAIAKRSAALKGRKPKNFDAMLALAHASPKKRGSEHHLWKGDAAGYSALHAWVRLNFGTPSICDRCKTTTARRYEWANKSRQYLRQADDWERLCASCHRKDGYAAGEYATWNKGKTVQSNTGRTHIKKGQRLSPLTEFQKKPVKT